jgi:hypothetical protein
MALLPAIAPISESRSRRLITDACSRCSSRMKIGSLQILLASRPESNFNRSRPATQSIKLLISSPDH